MSAILAFFSCICLAVCPYELEGDVNEDCVVDLQDVALVAGNWLVNCNINPSDPACDTTQAMTDMQKNQFRYIKEALELFREEFGEYPPATDNSDLYDPIRDHIYDPTPYGGANKLAEALVGLDMLGFHPNSDFRSDGINIRDDGTGMGITEVYSVYHADFDDFGWETAEENVQNRKGPFIDLGVANVFEMRDVYQDTGNFRTSAVAPSQIEQSLVLCDVFEKTRHTGKVTGMPILYYRARSMYTQQVYDDIDLISNDIYYYPDNQNLLELGMADGSGVDHVLGDGVDDHHEFENMILDPRVTAIQRPYRPDGYILISAGPDGMYGTADDLFDFELLEDEPLPIVESKDIMQMSQFHSIMVGLEMYRSEFGDYPPSNDNLDLYDPTNEDPEDPTPYGGANKLAEAIVGLDMIGFHPNSGYRSDGINVRDDGVGGDENYAVYHADNDDPGWETAEENIQARRGPYLDLGNANVFTMQDVYHNTGSFRYSSRSPSEISRSLVLCDVFVKNRGRGKYTGMPILYYKARRIYTEQNCDDIESISDDIYYYADNWNLLNLDVNLGFSSGYYPEEHPLSDGIDDFLDFENMILNPYVTAINRPYRADSYILISAGEDGVYGTADDVTNFDN